MLTQFHWLWHASPRRRQSRLERFTPVCVRVCFFRTISQKPMQLESPNLTQNCSTMSPANSFILGSKGQRSRSWVTKSIAGVDHGTLVSCECWRLLVQYISNSPPVAVQSIVISVSVCLSVCLSACLSLRSIILKATSPNFTQFSTRLPVAVVRLSDDDGAIRYVFPVLWTTSYFRTQRISDSTNVARLPLFLPLMMNGANH